MTNDTISITDLIKLLTDLQNKPDTPSTSTSNPLQPLGVPAQDIQIVKFKSGGHEGDVIEQFNKWKDQNKHVTVINTHFAVFSSNSPSHYDVLFVTYKR